VKHRACLTILTAALLSSVAVAQMPSRFDLTANASLGNAQLVGAPSGSKVYSLGWQTTGVTHFNRWLGMSSQFSAGYANINGLQLIGYAGSGNIQRYSSLVGPRITFLSRSRINPYVEGLGGVDYARTKFTSNGTIVTGRELESAYAIGGGAQIRMSRRIGFNVEAHYFETNHSVALLGWTPSHLQISAGLVFRLSQGRQILADQRPMPVPSPSETQSASAESTTSTDSVPSAPVTTMIVTAAPNIETTARPTPPVQATTERQVVHEQPAVAAAPKPTPATVVAVAPNIEPPARPQPAVKATTETQVVHQQPAVAAAPKPATPVVAQFQPSTIVTPSNVAPGLSQIAPSQAQPQSQSSVSAVSAPAVVAVAPSRPVQTAAQTSQPQPATAPRPAVSSVPANTYTAAPAQPLSLGEYARKLREKKQQHKQADWQ